MKHGTMLQSESIIAPAHVSRDIHTNYDNDYDCSSLINLIFYLASLFFSLLPFTPNPYYRGMI